MVIAIGAVMMVSCGTQAPLQSRAVPDASAAPSMVEGQPDEDSSGVKVHFGTNRMASEKAFAGGRGPYFTSENANKLIFGTLLVTVDERNHVRGETKGMKFDGPPERMKDTAFLEQLRDDLDDGEDSLLIFVHGYNVTFENAAKRSAQLKYDLPFAGQTAFYSWPSKGSLLGYWSDETAVREAEPFMEEFLVKTVKGSGAKKVYIIAHSMGNRAFTSVMPRVRRALKGSSSIEEIILAAPDIDAEVFRRDIAPRLMKEPCATTVYSSKKDKALWVSWLVHGFSPRAGQRVVGIEGMESIDAGATDTSKLGLGHSYYAKQSWLLNDLDSLMDGNRPAERVNTLEEMDLKRGAWLLRRKPSEKIAPNR